MPWGVTGLKKLRIEPFLDFGLVEGLGAGFLLEEGEVVRKEWIAVWRGREREGRGRCVVFWRLKVGVGGSLGAGEWEDIEGWWWWVTRPWGVDGRRRRRGVKLSRGRRVAGWSEL